ncbi:hypothetical protein [Actinocorallia longicatena]|uniref:Uncharacterized protein n=1 Tax=Actinocorallia longicatena TaxID=111803 RepID=A0ABP6QN89_9ACTN
MGELYPAHKWLERMELRFAKKGFLSAKPTFVAGYGRACRDCGHVALLLDDASRRRLDEVADRLDDVEGHAPEGERRT